MAINEVLLKWRKYDDIFLEKAKPLLLDSRVSTPAAGGAFTLLEKPELLDWLEEAPKTVQRHLRGLRASTRQMNWAATALLHHKDSPWRSFEVKISRIEHGSIKLLEIVKSGIAFGRFSEVHEEDLSKLIQNVHRLYMDLFERRGQELLRAAIKSEGTVVHLLPESEGRIPDDTRVMLQELVARPDLNGKAGHVRGWDYALQRYTVELEIAEVQKPSGGAALPSNPDFLALEDMEDDDEPDEDLQAEKSDLAIPKKLMVMQKNVQVDLEPSRHQLAALVKDWDAWRRRPRSVSATQDAEAVASALGPPLEAMAGHLQEAASAVSTASALGHDGAELVASTCREALCEARTLAAKLLGEEPKDPPLPPPLREPPPALVLVPTNPEAQLLKDAAEVAQASIELKAMKKKKRSRSRSRSRRRRRRSSSSSGSHKGRRKRR
eukprot:NODE_3103_length_2092_cov_3.599491.p1 GENE.NODE_3103_length_2092_cov_3.599491~~NODE_3103_length_2092_cov_3.599491.p1  ORF type:complete len:437 (-),score=176.68 NODE_3103_length_2092_cov_3.599491:773-2083(-)